jgi:hypothetical protein
MLGRPSLSCAGAPSPQAAVGAKEVCVHSHDLVEVRTQHLLLTLDDPADANRELIALLS